jgi:hypothetical protein
MGVDVKKNLLKYPILFLFWSAVGGGSDGFITAWGCLPFARSTGLFYLNGR